MALPTSVPCSEERVGTGFHEPRTGSEAEASPAGGGLGRGTSKSLATLSGSISVCWVRGVACGTAVCCKSAGLGAMAVAASVLTVRAAKYAPSSTANRFSAHEYLWRTSSMHATKSNCHASLDLLWTESPGRPHSSRATTWQRKLPHR